MHYDFLLQSKHCASLSIPQTSQGTSAGSHSWNLEFPLRLKINLGTGRVPKRMNLWKSSKGLGGGYFQSKKLYCRFWILTRAFSVKKYAVQFSEGGGVKGRLELFRKFIQNGTVKRPLIPLHTRTNKRTCESTTKVCWGSHCKIHFWGLGSNSIQEISFFRVTRKKSVGARLQLSGIQTLIFWEPRFIYVAVQSWDLKIHSSGSQDFIFWDANFLGIQTFVVYDPNFKIHVIHPTIQL